MYVLLFVYIIVYSREEKVDNSKCEKVDRFQIKYFLTCINSVYHRKNHKITLSSQL